MKRWPLRWKIALYAAAFGVVATIAGAATTWILMRYSEISALDRKIDNEARDIFANLHAIEYGTYVFPVSSRDRMVELWSAEGKLLYLSPTLPKADLGDGSTKKFHIARINNRPFRVGTFFYNDMTLRIAADLTDINQIGRDIILGMLGAIPTVLFVVAVGGRWVARCALGPVDAIRHAAARITPQNLSERLPMPPAQDEIAALVAVLNQSFERLQRTFEQSVRFSADASHHLKTPLAILRAGIEELLNDSNSSPEQHARAEALLEQVRQLTSVAENLLLLARADAGRLELHPAAFDFREVLDGACDDTRALAEPQGISVATEMPDHLPMVADRAAVELIVQNLVHNAVKYNERGGCIRLTALAENGQIKFVIANNGEAIPKDRLEHVFERFYRARSDQRTGGQGLGLSIARELAVAQRGDLALVRSDGEWTEFRLTLPRA